MVSRRRRRIWNDNEKRRIVAESFVPGRSVSVVAGRNDVNANLLFLWRRDPRFNGVRVNDAPDEDPTFLVVEVSEDDPKPDVVSDRDDDGHRFVEIAFGDFRIRCSEGVDEDALRRIVSTLRSLR